ncbi:hypothetical protein GQ53DRAFT_659286 [Thozetella sp. PMI_491]|nr:hypothetical protein GQ53DRAFT_659286 [Thozetella sp. PMI_491]
MSRLFRRPSTKVPSPHSDLETDAGQSYPFGDPDPASGYSSLLNDHDASDGGESPPAAQLQGHRHRRAKSSPAPAAWASAEFAASRPWLSTAEGRPSWTGERPPTRKLVKDPNGSARPSMSIELSDSDGEKDKGLVQRGIARLRGLYRKDK